MLYLFRAFALGGGLVVAAQSVTIIFGRLVGQPPLGLAPPGLPPNLRLVGPLTSVANPPPSQRLPMSVAAALGGILPAKWGIVIENKPSGVLDTTEGNHKKLYQGVSSQFT